VAPRTRRFGGHCGPRHRVASGRRLGQPSRRRIGQPSRRRIGQPSRRRIGQPSRRADQFRCLGEADAFHSGGYLGQHRCGRHGDSGSDATYISSPVTNPKPKVILQVTPRYAGAYENHPVGVWYSGTLWAVINEDQANMDTSGNATFNVLVGASSTGGGKTGVQKTTAANQAGDTTVVNNATTNGDQDAFVIETPDYNPSDKGGTYDSSPTGEYYYNGSNAAIFNELGATMALKSNFDLLMFTD
jgi:hypothetical protein